MMQSKKATAGMAIFLAIAAIPLSYSWHLQPGLATATEAEKSSSAAFGNSQLASSLTLDEIPVAVYEHSVIPGGFTSLGQFEQLMNDNSETASHFASFQVKSAKWVSVTGPRSVYVSYRIGDKIYWTNKTVALAKGELLITDGTRTIRARCGNDISDTAQQPVSDSQPLLADLDTTLPEYTPVYSLVYSPVYGAPLYAAAAPPFDMPSSSTESSTAAQPGPREMASVEFPYSPLMFNSVTGAPVTFVRNPVSSAPNSAPVTAPISVPIDAPINAPINAPIATPEPSDFLLLCIGFAAIAVGYLWTRTVSGKVAASGYIS